MDSSILSTSAVQDESASDHIFIDLDSESSRYMLGNLAAAEAGIAPLHLGNRAPMSSFDGPLGPGRRRFLGL